MIDSTFVEAIIENAQTGVVTIDGVEFATKPVFNAPLADEPLPGALAISTLTGLVDYCKAFIKPDTDHVLHVQSYHQVVLVSKIEGERKQRATYIAANCGAGLFEFGTFLPHAEFMIGIQALFQDYGDRQKVMKVVGTIRDNVQKTSNDDGITQTVTASAGIALSQEVPLPNPVLLRPFRTFPEIEQPPSNFVLRAQAGKNGMPEIALFEADGGHWKHEAITNIREYLAKETAGIVIVA